MKKTILYEQHLNAGGKMVEFAGYLLPIEYSSITEEHLAVRNNVGVFDVSHMGEIRIKGTDTMPFINYLITNDIINAPNKKMLYGIMLYDSGGAVDDLMIYKYNSFDCLLIVNAANLEKDWQYINQLKHQYNVEIINQSDYYAQIALQGPQAVVILSQLTNYDFSTMKLFDFDHLNIFEDEYLVSRSGYTGSDGFEIYSNKDAISKLFKHLLNLGVKPCGLGCRDTLRFEAAMPLYGHELDKDITPLEAGLNYAVKMNKGDFIGRSALEKQIEQGISRKVIGLELLEKGIARSGYEVIVNNQIIGHITTGYMIPNSSNCYAMALIKTEFCGIGSIVNVKIRNRLVKAKIRNKKFLNKKYVK